MIKNTDNLKKSRNTILCFFTIIILCMVLFSLGLCVSAGSYTPAPPAGPSSGDIDIRYEYFVYTIDTGSSWMFDWGDGTYSEWIEVLGGETSISQSHDWLSAGTYEVRVKHQNVYSVESSWSNPIYVDISVSLDIDGDGWDNEIEESYGTSTKDSTDFPLDTDGDGTADEDSLDLKYLGDADDDGDGLDDEIEEELTSDSKDESDVTSIKINQVSHYLIDINKDGQNDKFYNTNKDTTTSLEINEDGLYLIDYQGDGIWDYFYSSAQGLSEYKEETSSEFPWLLAIISIVIVVLLLVFFLFKKGLLYVYEEEYTEEE